MIRRLGRLSAVCAAVLCLAVCCTAADFSADMVTKIGGNTITSKVFRQGTKLRQEMSMGSMKQIVILRPDKKATWVVNPQSKTYSEMPFDPRMSDVSILKNEAELKKVATKKSLGTAKVSGFVCDKFQLTYKNKQMGTSTVWFAKRLDWPIKTETKTVHGTVVTECKSVKMGGQSASLFEIPKGYKKVAMPGPPGMAGGPKPHMKPAPKKPK